MSPYIVDSYISMCDASNNISDEVDQLILSLEEELKSGVLVGAIESRQAQAEVVVDATPTPASRIRKRSYCRSSCSSLGSSKRSLRSREPTNADFLKATGQHMEDISVSELRKYFDRNLVRPTGSWKDVLQSQKAKEEEEFLEVSAHLDDDNRDDAYDPLNLSCDLSFDEGEEGDILWKASLHSICTTLEVEGIMLLSQLEAEQGQSRNATEIIR
jgi:hypothetical protein